MRGCQKVAAEYMRVVKRLWQGIPERVSKGCGRVYERSSKGCDRYRRGCQNIAGKFLATFYAKRLEIKKNI